MNVADAGLFILISKWRKPQHLVKPTGMQLGTEPDPVQPLCPGMVNQGGHDHLPRPPAPVGGSHGNPSQMTIREHPARTDSLILVTDQDMYRRRVPAVQINAWVNPLLPGKYRLPDGDDRLSFPALKFGLAHSQANRIFTCHRLLSILEGSLDKLPEQRMGAHGFGLELRMELTSQEPGVVCHLHNLHQPMVRGFA